MNHKRDGFFSVLEEETNCNTRFEEHQDFVETKEELKFIKIKTIEGNQFSTPFQDIWTNLEQTHQVYFVYDPVVNTNYLRIRGDIENRPKAIRELGMWFLNIHYTEISVNAHEAIENDDEDEQAKAIFDFVVNSQLYFPEYSDLFEKYSSSPSVKVRLATVRAIGFHLWSDCPFLDKFISSDPNPAVRAYATETLRQIQQPDFDPDDLYEHPENYPDSLERVTEKGLVILPQIKDDLQAWMKDRGYLAMDALVLYQYLVETYGEFKPTESQSDTPSTEDSDNSSELDTTQKQNDPENAKPKDLAEWQKELKSNKQKLTELRSQLKKVEERIENARRTNIFGRKQSGENERERDRLAQEIKDTKNRIADCESAIKALEE